MTSSRRLRYARHRACARDPARAAHRRRSSPEAPSPSLALCATPPLQPGHLQPSPLPRLCSSRRSRRAHWIAYSGRSERSVTATLMLCERRRAADPNDGPVVGWLSAAGRRRRPCPGTRERRAPILFYAHVRRVRFHGTVRSGVAWRRFIARVSQSTFGSGPRIAASDERSRHGRDECASVASASPVGASTPPH